MDEIVKLLEQATTPLERSILLRIMEQSRADEEHRKAARELTAALQNIAASFASHRTEFQDHRIEFTKHVADEGQLLTWGTRVFAITSSMLVFIVGLFGWYTVHHIIDVNAAQQIVIDINTNRITKIEAIVNEERERHK
jgi:hypothetical protein